MVQILVKDHYCYKIMLNHLVLGSSHQEGRRLWRLPLPVPAPPTPGHDSFGGPGNKYKDKSFFFVVFRLVAPGSQGSLAAATVGDVSEELVLNLHSGFDIYIWGAEKAFH